MHTTIVAAADWQFNISGLLPCCKKKNFGPFVGPPFCGAPVRPNMLNMLKSASDRDHGSGREKASVLQNTERCKAVRGPASVDRSLIDVLKGYGRLSRTGHTFCRLLCSTGQPMTGVIAVSGDDCMMALVGQMEKACDES